MASFVGVTQGTIGQIEDGTNKRSSHLLQIAEFLGVSPAWLEYGEGGKESEGITLQDSEKVLISAYRQLNEEDKNIISKIIKSFIGQTYRSDENA